MTSTTKTEETEILLKTDRLGRVRMPAEKRELILDRFEQSGMSGQAFAARIGVKYSTFATWIGFQQFASVYRDKHIRGGLCVWVLSVNFPPF